MHLIFFSSVMSSYLGLSLACLLQTSTTLFGFSTKEGKHRNSWHYNIWRKLGGSCEQVQRNGQRHIVYPFVSLNSQPQMLFAAGRLKLSWMTLYPKWFKNMSRLSPQKIVRVCRD
eukprot:PhF_6_TR36173/c1_g1_i1/m.52669